MRKRLYIWHCLDWRRGLWGFYPGYCSTNWNTHIGLGITGAALYNLQDSPKFVSEEFWCQSVETLIVEVWSSVNHLDSHPFTESNKCITSSTWFNSWGDSGLIGISDSRVLEAYTGTVLIPNHTTIITIGQTWVSGHNLNFISVASLSPLGELIKSIFPPFLHRLSESGADKF